MNIFADIRNVPTAFFCEPTPTINRVFSQRQIRPFVMRHFMQWQTTTIFTKRRSVVFWPNDNIVLWSFVSTMQMVRVCFPRRNFCVRLKHNALSALDIFKINLFRAKFRRYVLLAAGVIQLKSTLECIRTPKKTRILWHVVSKLEFYVSAQTV